MRSWRVANMDRLFISYKTVLQAIKKRCTSPDDLRNHKLGLVDLQINSNTDCHKRVNYSFWWDKLNLHTGGPHNRFV